MKPISVSNAAEPLQRGTSPPAPCYSSMSYDEGTDAGTSDATRLPSPPVSLLGGASLFLDFDGTLVRIAERPDAVVVDQRLDRLMDHLDRALHGRLAIISGRAMAEIDTLLARGRFAIGGSHGMEMRWPGGRTVTPTPPAGLKHVVAEMRALQASHPELIVEEKPFGAALHYRLLPDAEETCRALAARLSQGEGLSLQTGKMVFEIKAAGQDKGSALLALMEDPAFAGTTPIFIGDDDTDEAGFRAAAALGGAGILVGAPRATAARYRLEDVTTTHDWLERALEALA
jgi:trehalose 6-phosphate phosphatase